MRSASVILLFSLLLLNLSSVASEAVTFPAHYCGTGTRTFTREWKPMYEIPKATCVEDSARFKVELHANGSAVVYMFYPVSTPDLQGKCVDEGSEGYQATYRGTHDRTGTFTIEVYNYILDANVPYIQGSFTEESLTANFTHYASSSASEEWVTFDMELGRAEGVAWDSQTWEPCATSPLNVSPLKLTYPAGESPKVFTRGWIFGAECMHNGVDCSKDVKWEGTGTFTPDRGPLSRPAFAANGANRIELSVEINGETFKKAYDVQAVNTANYARIGTLAKVPTDAHGCLACPHPSVGPIITGSDTVGIEDSSGGVLPAARVGDRGVHAACCGPNMYRIIGGDSEVLIDGRPAARMGDPTQHCGGTGRIMGRPASFDTNLRTVNVPSIRLESEAQVLSDLLYSASLLLTDTAPLTFTLTAAGIDNSGSELPSILDLATGRMHIPYLNLGGTTTYNLDLDMAIVGDQAAFVPVATAENVPDSNPKRVNVRPISNADLWDISQGTIVTESSGMLAGTSVLPENIFRDGEVVFQDGLPAGTEHWVKWSTAAPVTVRSVNLVAAHDGTINERGFSSFKLYAGDGAGTWTVFYEERMDPDGDQKYGGGPNFPAENYLETSAYFTPVTAQHFQAVFVQAGDQSGPRIVELDAYLQ